MLAQQVQYLRIGRCGESRHLQTRLRATNGLFNTILAVFTVLTTGYVEK